MTRWTKFCAALACIAAWTTPATAQTTASVSANIGVSLTSKCYFDTSTALDFTGVAYSAFTTTAVTSVKTATISCTRGATAPTVAWDGAAAGATSTGQGVVAGLQYSILASRGAVTNGTALTFNGTTFAGGTAATSTVTVTLTLPPGQPGDSGTSTTATRTLTVSY
jgi:hypothetical protein